MKRQRVSSSAVGEIAGLPNLGNSCYMNASIQLLRQTSKGDGGVTCARGHIADSIDEGADVLHKLTLDKVPGAMKGRQYDAHQYIMYVIENCPELRQQYHYLTNVMYKCQLCLAVSTSEDVRLDLQLAIQQTDSVKQAVDRATTGSEVIEGFKCSSCGDAGDGIRTTVITKPPENLLVVLKRWGQDLQKTHSEVSHSPSIQIADCQYNLKCTVNHIGHQPDRGHYTTSIIVEDGNAILVNDDKVSAIDPEDVYTSDESYILLYTKEKDNSTIDTDDDVIFVEETLVEPTEVRIVKTEASESETDLETDLSFSRMDCHRSKVAAHCDDRVISTDEAVTMMVKSLNSELNSERINGVSCNAIFLCTVTGETQRLDLRRDGMGVWEEGHRTTKIPFKGQKKCSSVEADTFLWRLTYKCKSLKTLKRTEIFRRDLNGKLLSPIFIQYHFEGEPQNVSVLPHGNSKSGLSYHPTDKSLLEQINSSTTDSAVSAMNIYNKMSIERPISVAPSTGSVPRSIRQMQDAKYRHKTAEPDPIATIMTMMTSERGNTNKFIRRLTLTEDNYSIVLYSDDQLQYLAQHPKATIHVDVTFNMSETPTNMYALVTTIRANEYQGDPLLLGPIILTTRMRCKDYVILWQDLCNNNAEIKKLSIFVTDGELALVNSIRECFPDAHILRCMLHLKDNCRIKAREYLPESIVRLIMQRTSQLMTCTPTAFKEQAEKIVSDLTDLGMKETCESNMGKFVKYYKRVILPVVYDNLVDKLIEAGVCILQSTNNPAESMNAKLKKQLETGKQVDQVCQQLKSIVLAQHEELQKAHRNMSHQLIPKRIEEDNPANSQPDDDFTNERDHVEDEVFTQLSQTYGHATVQGFESGSRLCTLTEGVHATLVKYGTEKEVVVDNLKCTCQTYIRMKLCAHVMAVAKFKGPGSVAELIQRSVLPSLSLQLKPTSAAGKKVSATSVRKGGRTTVPRPSTQKDDGDYFVVRGTSRRKVCNGCRTTILGERFVLRHTCRQSFMKRDDSGKLVSFTPTNPGNHHFHLQKDCVTKTHPKFTGRVVLDPTLNSAVQAIKPLLVGTALYL